MSDSAPHPSASGGVPLYRPTFARNVWRVVKTVQARLRFVVVLAAVGGVLAYWDALMAYYEKWSRPVASASVARAADDEEFWCPMHPTIVRDRPDKCPICGMPLSKRKKGGKEEPLPPGVVSRVQLTPWRVALAGIRTAAVTFEPLTKDIQTVGFVEFDERQLSRISVRPTGSSRIDKLYVNVTGQTVAKGEPLALLYSPELVTTAQNLLDARKFGNAANERISRDRLRLWGIDDEQIEQLLRTGKPITHLTIRSPIGGHVIRKYPVEGEYVQEGGRLYDVADLSTVWVEAQIYEDDLAFIRPGLAVSATTRAFPAQEFRGTVAFVHPHLDAATRTLRVRFNIDNPEHELRPGMYATVQLRVPTSRLDRVAVAWREGWRDGVAADLTYRSLFAPSGTPAAAGLEPLVRSAVGFAAAQRGLVPAVPEQAVIDTGSRKLVYRQAEPDVYEGLEVQLGPRSGNFYPVLRGLDVGDLVTTAGTFLLDAETRLTAGAGMYSAASGGSHDEHAAVASVRPSMTADDDAKVRAVRTKMSRVDRRLVEAQDYCPVLKGNRLGSMGTPYKIDLHGRPVFLCCPGCRHEAEAQADKILSAVDQLIAHSSARGPKRTGRGAAAGPTGE